MDSGYCQRATADAVSLFQVAQELPLEAFLFLLRARHSFVVLMHIFCFQGETT